MLDGWLCISNEALAMEWVKSMLCDEEEMGEEVFVTNEDTEEEEVSTFLKYSSKYCGVNRMVTGDLKSDA
jgi:uncharacterized OsmC-like protein